MIQLNRKHGQLSLVFALLAALSMTSGCAKQKKADETGVPDSANADESTGLGDSDTGHAMGLQTIQFPYDSFVLSSDAKAKLKANAEILKDKKSVHVQIEGHCDERGGIQYNIALGEKRANAVRKFLMDLGTDGNRVTTISFGKERPLDPASNEAAWSKNRRANFVITAR